MTEFKEGIIGVFVHRGRRSRLVKEFTHENVHAAKTYMYSLCQKGFDMISIGPVKEKEKK